MVNYKNGKIYKIVSVEGDCVYYGSTVQKINHRFAKHKTDHKRNPRFASSELMKYKDAKIYLVENYPCKNRKELLEREGYYIRNNKCVNVRVAGRTRKEFYNDNRDKILKQNKVRIKCKCGRTYQYVHKSRHFKTKVHIQNI